MRELKKGYEVKEDTMKMPIEMKNCCPPRLDNGSMAPPMATPGLVWTNPLQVRSKHPVELYESACPQIHQIKLIILFSFPKIQILILPKLLTVQYKLNRVFVSPYNLGFTCNNQINYNLRKLKIKLAC